ncbi:MAG: hypothetical protein PVJ89_01590 [Planctomycetota bacterium]|jgi:hypothetical protein
MDFLSDFQNDRKWCPACDVYVSYLMSIEKSYCVQCGGEVRLFNEEDWLAFSEKMDARKPRRRGKKDAGGARKRRDTA